MARYDDLNTTSIAYATFVSSVVLVVVILLVRALCYGWVEGEDERKLANAHYVGADENISEQKARIAGYESTEVEALPPAEQATPAEQSNPKESTGGGAAKVERLSIPVDVAGQILLKELSTTADSPK